MTGFDFGKHFGKQEEANTSETTASLDPFEQLNKMLQDVQKSAGATSSKKYTGPITQEEAQAAFEAKHGSPTNFMDTVFDQMIEPFCEAMVKAATQVKQKNNNPVPITILTASAIEVARECNQQMMVDNYRGGAQKEALNPLNASVKAGLIGSAVEAMLPSTTPADNMIAVHALLGVISMKLGELTMQLEAQQLAQEAREQ